MIKTASESKVGIYKVLSKQPNKMSLKPFFSIVIPTMNRPKVLESALASVLGQSFRDFEVIVSDNSNNAGDQKNNFETITKYSGDSRLRYIRPPHWMNMPEHWEFATREALGLYVLVLTDRFVMCPNTLIYLRTQLTASNDSVEVIAWDVSSSYNPSGIVEASLTTGAVRELGSRATLREFANLDYWGSSFIWSTQLPRILNCCYRNCVAQRIRELHDRLFFPLSPDYTGGYLLLAYTDHFTYCDVPLYISHGSQSNGKRGLIYGFSSYLNTLDEENYFTGLPSSLETATNIILSDLLMVRDLLGDNFSDIRINTMNLLMANYREFFQRERLGSQIDLSTDYQEWWAEVNKLPLKEQIQVKQHVTELQKIRCRHVRLRRLVVKWGLDKYIHTVRAAFRRIRHQITGKPVYKNVLAAAAGEDNFINNN